MKFITSFNRRLHAEYAHRLMATAHMLPGELVVYAEDKIDGVKAKDLHMLCPKLVTFKERLKEFRPPDWSHDVVRFANKAFAMAHGLFNETGLVAWIDADCVPLKPLPEKFLRRMLDNAYCAYFGRVNPPYTETGFILFDCSHPQHKKFVNAFRDVYVSGTIFKLPGWHDCYAFDHARQAFEGFRCVGDGMTGSTHPIVTSPLGEYIDHLKGPKRKRAGYSPESIWRSPVLGDAQRRDTPVEG